MPSIVFESLKPLRRIFPVFHFIVGLAAAIYVVRAWARFIDWLEEY